jgi:pimeloyl-ACP methyl ester carboxylesterase
MPHADIGGVKLYYEECGDGEPIVFVHEFAGDHLSWEPQVRYFSRRYRCVTFNARGYPPSDVPEDASAYSHAIAVDDVAGIMRHLGIERAHLVGLSMGSFTSVYFGLRYPEMALSLTVAGTGYGALGGGRAQFHAEVEEGAQRFLEEGSAAVAESHAQLSTRATFGRKDPRGFAEFQRRYAEHSAEGSAHTLRNVQKTRPAFPELENELRAMTTPMLVIAGDDDDPSLEGTLYLKRTVPSAALSVFPATGHTVNLEEPDLFNRTVQEFLDTVTAGRWPTRELPKPGDRIA